MAPYLELQALAVHDPEMLPVVLRGIDPSAAATVTEIGQAITQGHLADLTSGSGRVIVGAVIAERLGLSAGRCADAAGAHHEHRRYAGAQAA